MNKAEIQKLIGSIGLRATKLTQDVQTAAAHCVLHAVAHGDVTLADSLITAIGKQGRKSSLRAWFEITGCMVQTKGSKTLSLNKFKREDMAKLDQAALMATLMAAPWEDAVPEPEPVSVLDISVKLDKFLVKLENDATQCANDGTPVHGKAFLDAMVKAAREFHARDVLSESYEIVEG